MKEKEKKQENMDVKKHLTPEDDEKLHEAYINALGEILENDDDDCRDDQNQSGRGVEVEAFAEVDDADQYGRQGFHRAEDRSHR